MIQIDSTIVSDEIIERHFACDIAKCRGMCCVYGNSGAPLEDEEIVILNEILPKLKPYMTLEGIAAIEQQGVYSIDFDNEKVTPLAGSDDGCAFCFKKNNIVCCAIERAFVNGDTNFRKPVSCHLYPIRITRYKDFDALNFHNWSICNDALTAGKKKGKLLYDFLKEPLIRKYGAEWYEQLCQTAKLLLASKTQP